MTAILNKVRATVTEALHVMGQNHRGNSHDFGQYTDAIGQKLDLLPFHHLAIIIDENTDIPIAATILALSYQLASVEVFTDLPSQNWPQRPNISFKAISEAEKSKFDRILAFAGTDSEKNMALLATLNPDGRALLCDIAHKNGAAITLASRAHEKGFDGFVVPSGSGGRDNVLIIHPGSTSDGAPA